MLSPYAPEHLGKGLAVIVLQIQGQYNFADEITLLFPWKVALHPRNLRIRLHPIGQTQLTITETKMEDDAARLFSAIAASDLELQV
jgi:hypothetical protein